MEIENIEEFEEFLEEEKNLSFEEAATIGRYLYEFMEQIN